MQLLILSLILLTHEAQSIKVSLASNKSFMDKCQKGTEKEAGYAYTDASKKTTICCDDKDIKEFDTSSPPAAVNQAEARDKRSSLCCTLSDSPADKQSKMPCCNNHFRNSQDGSCQKSEDIISIKLTASDDEYCKKIGNKTDEGPAKGPHAVSMKIPMWKIAGKTTHSFCCNSNKIHMISLDHNWCCILRPAPMVMHFATMESSFDNCHPDSHQDIMSPANDRD